MGSTLLTTRVYPFLFLRFFLDLVIKKSNSPYSRKKNWSSRLALPLYTIIYSIIWQLPFFACLPLCLPLSVFVLVVSFGFYFFGCFWGLLITNSNKIKPPYHGCYLYFPLFYSTLPIFPCFLSFNCTFTLLFIVYPTLYLHYIDDAVLPYLCAFPCLFTLYFLNFWCHFWVDFPSIFSIYLSSYAFPYVFLYILRIELCIEFRI